MAEKIFTIESTEPLLIYGSNDDYIAIIAKYFENLTLIPRGNLIKVIGNEQDIDLFEEKLNAMIHYINNFGPLNTNILENILWDNQSEPIRPETEAYQPHQTLLFTPSGSQIKAKTFTQSQLVNAIHTNDMVFALGPAGTGKTYIAVALAIKALKEKKVKRIILTRPAVEAGENLGFLPGDLKEKLDPYMQPLYDALSDLLGPEKLKEYLSNGIIQIAPLAFMRGRTLSHAFVILDEAQNSTESQMKMFLTRMGQGAKFVITGDLSQIDLPKHQQSGLVQAVMKVSGIKGIAMIKFTAKDGLRHHLVTQILGAYGEL